MEKDHTGAIRGMAIANVVISSLYVAALLALCLLVVSFGFGIPNEVVGELMGNLSFDWDLHEFYLDLDGAIPADRYGDYPAEALTEAVLDAVIAFAMLAVIIFAVLSLVSAVVALANAKRPEKRGLIMVWSIIGVVSSFLSGSVPCFVMFVVSAVFASSDRRLYRDQMSQAQATDPN